MRQFLRSRALSFQHAFAGWSYVLRTQRNAWIHAVASIVVVVVGLWLKLSPRDWALIVLAVGMVWVAEFINTAVEVIVDLTSPQQNELAKIGKDVGAAAVLIAAVCAFLIGLLILGPPLWMELQPWFPTCPP
jgi:diacylglycerol kinase (ATP)